MMTEANVGRLVNKLTQMRGAALKVGQFLSIQGKNSMLKPQFSCSPF
jgi:predicted unusual protein kinase regulating ubiquinone biosynthesis (AarF/ABC1/UbiB family)